MNMFKGVPIQKRHKRMQKIFLRELYNAEPNHVGPKRLSSSVGYKALYLSGVPEMAMNSLLELGYASYTKHSGYRITDSGKKFYKENYIPKAQPLPVGASGPVDQVFPDFFRAIAIQSTRLGAVIKKAARVLCVTKGIAKVGYMPAAEEDLFAEGRSGLLDREFSKVYGEDASLEWEERKIEQKPTPAPQQAPTKVGAVGALLRIVNMLFPGALEETRYWELQNDEWRIEFRRRNKKDEDIHDFL